MIHISQLHPQEPTEV